MGLSGEHGWQLWVAWFEEDVHAQVRDIVEKEDRAKRGTFLGFGDGCKAGKNCAYDVVCATSVLAWIKKN